MDKKSAFTKKEELIRQLQSYGSLLIAFSGGVDSSFLLALSHAALGDKVLAVTAGSAIHPQPETEAAARFARERGIRHLVVSSNEMDLPEFRANPLERCYICKKSLLGQLKQIAAEQCLSFIAHGANTDDARDFRPGSKAAAEAGALAPLADAGLTKEEIRFLAREMGLSHWNRPSRACLASRIPYGETITLEKLQMIEQAEEFLASLGFLQYRLRHHGNLARIEVPVPELHKFLKDDFRQKIVAKLREIGYQHITLDLEGFISGSLNRVLAKQNRQPS